MKITISQENSSPIEIEIAERSNENLPAERSQEGIITALGTITAVYFGCLILAMIGLGINFAIDGHKLKKIIKSLTPEEQQRIAQIFYKGISEYIDAAKADYAKSADTLKSIFNKSKYLDASKTEVKDLDTDFILKDVNLGDPKSLLKFLKHNVFVLDYSTKRATFDKTSRHIEGYINVPCSQSTEDIDDLYEFENKIYGDLSKAIVAAFSLKRSKNSDEMYEPVKLPMPKKGLFSYMYRHVDFAVCDYEDPEEVEVYITYGGIIDSNFLKKEFGDIIDKLNSNK